MLKCKDDFYAVVSSAIDAAEALCLDSKEDRQLATDLIVSAIFREMQRYSDTPGTDPVVENEALRVMSGMPEDLKQSPAFDMLAKLINECSRLRKAEHEMRQIACYTMRKRLEHEEECPAYDDHEDADENDA